jgi:phosphoribosylamine-glycine ligase
MAAGKGVLIIHDLAEQEELRNMLVHQKFGAGFKSNSLLELSCFVLTDGKVIKYFQQQGLQTHWRRRHWIEYGRNGSCFSVPYVDAKWKK